MLSLVVVLAAAVLNRARGSKGMVPILKNLPGRALWYVTPLMGLLAWVVQPWPVALLIMLAYLAFNTPAIGRWYTLGTMARDASGPPSSFEVVIERIAGDSDHAALLIRQVLASLGLLAASAVLGKPSFLTAFILFPIGAWLAYVWPWMLWRQRLYGLPNPILLAELTVGALWGALIILV